MARDLDIFQDIFSIWHFHVSLSSIITPWNLVSHTWAMLLPPISTCTLLVSFLLPLNIIKFDLSTFRDNLLVWSQVATFISSLLNLVLMAAASVPLMKMLVSSANMTVNITSDVIPKSLPYSKKAEVQVWTPGVHHIQLVQYKNHSC